MFTHSFLTYQSFYLLAFLTAIVVLILEGRKRHIPALPWFMLICTGFIFFMVGAKAASLTDHDWRTVSQFKPLNYSPGITVIGGILFSFVGLLLARYSLKLPWSILDAFAFTIPIGMCIQRFGCLQAGCCYGTASEVPWAITQKIDDHQILQSTVHPVQLYESIGCVLIVLLLLKMRNRFKAPVNFLFFSAMCYYVLRFCLDFFRDIHAYAFNVNYFAGLTSVQWLLFALIICSTVIISCREKFYTLKKDNPIHISRLRHIFFFVVLCLIVQAGSLWMNSVDRVIMFITLTPIVVILIMKTYSAVIIPPLRLAAFALIGCAVLLMSQTTVESRSVKNEVTETYNTISGGIMSGKINFEKELVTGGGTSCDGSSAPYTTSNLAFKEKYSSLGGGYARTWVRGEQSKLTAGLNLVASTFRETIEVDYNEFSSKKNTYFTANPYLTSDFKYIGFTAGMHLGNSSIIQYDDSEYAESMLTNSTFKPQFGIRAGRADGVYFAGHIYDNSIPLGLIPWQLGIGFGSKKIAGNSVELGVSAYSILYIAPTFVIKQNVVLKPYVGIGPGFNAALGESESSTGIVGAFSVSTIVGRKKR
ncbi:MAG: prolipoprotein diacylglyceryl transferase [Cyclobacteriaceae bacterium]|nr:prolipoprotein diacylglyceryl transferase [Cyclobacteriaceae bacterium]